MCGFISKCLGISSYLSTVDFNFHFLVIWKCIWYDFYMYLFLFLNLQSCVLWPRMWSMWSWRRMCILLPLGGLFYRCHVRSSWLRVLFRSCVLFLILFLPHQSVTDRQPLRSPSFMVDVSVYPFCSTGFSLINFDAGLLDVLVWGCYIFLKNFYFYWYKFSLYISDNLVLNSDLSEITTATKAFFS